MPTFYATDGFHIEITRPPGSNFSVVINLNDSLFSTITSAETDEYLTDPGTYTFTFLDDTASDPTSFTIFNYNTATIVGEIEFPISSPLILIAGIDGLSDKTLTITYPQQTYTFNNPSSQPLSWACTNLPVSCDGLEATVNALPDPKIIGNLADCSGDTYTGNEALPKSCNDPPPGGIYIFSIKNSVTDTLLYSRIECCCPIVTPEDNVVPGFVCTCPDWGRATSYNQTLFSSSVRLRQWVMSNAGAKADCKHIMAAKRIMGIEQPIYTDPPYSAPPPPPTPG